MINELRTTIGQPWFDIIFSAVILFLSVLFGLFLKIIVISRISKMAEHTSWKWDDPVVKYLKSVIIFWCVILGAYLAKEVWRPDISDTLNALADKVLIAVFGLSAVITVANIAAAIVGIYSGKIDQAVPLTNLTQSLIKIFIILLGGLMILNALGVSITPLLTTLGIGGLAVALAFQDTLSNFFSGFYIIIAKNIKVGDFIKLESGEDGFVEDIGWRSTRIKLLSNNTIFIPNSRLAQSIVTNYYLPGKELAVVVEVGVHYDSDLDFVEKVTSDAAKEVQQSVAGAVKDFEPVIRYHTFDASSINFKVFLRAQDITNTPLIKHEFIKRLHLRYKEKNICIPYPIRAINYTQEKANHESMVHPKGE